MKMLPVQSLDEFTTRLNSELAALSWDERIDLLTKIGRMELRMRSEGQDRPVWNGPLSEDKLLGETVAIQTDRGEQRGRVICYGVLNMGSEYERSVVVHVPSSGTHFEVPGSAVRVAQRSDAERMYDEIAMAERLRSVIDRLETQTAAETSPKKKIKRDPHFVEKLRSTAENHSNVRSIDEFPGSYKVTGRERRRKIYIFKNHLRVDLSGFSIDHPGAKIISDSDARELHLGNVRSQLDFSDKGTAYAAFCAALELM